MTMVRAIDCGHKQFKINTSCKTEESLKNWAARSANIPWDVAVKLYGWKLTTVKITRTRKGK